MELSHLFAETGQRRDGAMTLSEGPDTQRGLEAVADAVIAAASVKCGEYLRAKHAEDYWHDLDAEDMGAVTFGDAFPKIPIKRLPPKIVRFLRAFGPQKRCLRIAFTNRTTIGGRHFFGWYNGHAGRTQPEIYIGIDTAKFDLVLQWLREGRLTNTVLFHFLRDCRLTLVHELTHAYDDWVSAGKFERNARSDAARDAEIERLSRAKRGDPAVAARAQALYLNDPIEVNARYTGAVAALETKRRQMPWTDYLRAFQFEMKGWRALPPADQRRIVTRLAAQWQEGRMTYAPDLWGMTERLTARMRQITGEKVYLYYRDSSRALVVDEFGTEDASVVRAMLRTICQLADLRNLSVAVSQPIPAEVFREFGFVKQRGRQHDFSLPLGTYAYRRPRPTGLKGR